MGRKLGYAAAIAAGLLAATAWAAAARNPCTPDYGTWGLRFTTCNNPDQELPAGTEENACRGLYTQGYWSQSTEAAGQHRDAEEALIRNGLITAGWLVGTNTVGPTSWEFEADTELIPMEWGYEAPATLAQTIADYVTHIDNLDAALAAIGADLAISQAKADAEETLGILKAMRMGGHHASYDEDETHPNHEPVPYWVDHPGAAPPSFDPAVPSDKGTLTPQPEHLAGTVGHFTPTPPWDPTLTPALEILQCDGWSATKIQGLVRQYSDHGISCPTISGWTYTDRTNSTGRCNYRQPRPPVWVPPVWNPPLPNPPPNPLPPPTTPGYWQSRPDRTRAEPWDCRSQTFPTSIGLHSHSPQIPSGTRTYDHGRGRYTCEYEWDVGSSLRDFSSQLAGFGVNLSTSSKPANTVGTATGTGTGHQATPPTGWAVRWVEGAAAQWMPGPCGNKPCWPTFAPDVRMSPRLDQLLVGTPTWVWFDNVQRSCLPNADPPPNPQPPPPPAARDCYDLTRLDPGPPPRVVSTWEAWPVDETDPNTWRHQPLRTQAGTIWRAVFPQKVSIQLTPTTAGAPVRPPYVCWTDDHSRTVAAGEWAPGHRPILSDPARPGLIGPLGTTYGPLNPGVGDCTFTHDVAGPHTATITIHWIGKEGWSFPGNPLTWWNPDDPASPLLSTPPDPPAPTVQTVNVVFHELHTIPDA